MTKVHVLCGGTSSERDVSLRSGSAVAAALEASGYTVDVLDTADALIANIIDCDVVFPVLHGEGGEDGVLQQRLEEHGRAFVGSGSIASKLCFDKWQYRDFIMGKLPMAHAALVGAKNYREDVLSQSPFVLKPINGGSSIDTYIVRDSSQVPHAEIQDTFQRYPNMLLEQLIEGTELTVGVLGSAPLPVIEIIPPLNGEFDYENKYNGATQELCPPQHVSLEVQQRAQVLALQAHQLTGCRDFSRTDIMVNAAGELFLLETNTIPGMTDQSLFPKMAVTTGMSMPELCKTLVEMALRRAS